MRTAYPLTDLPSSSAFLRAYSDPQGYSRVGQWFRYNPHDPACFSQRLVELEALSADKTAHRPQAAAALKAQQQRWGGHLPDGNAAAIAAAESLADPKTFAIVTGQQVGLFGGPLYTQLKAACALRLARELTAAHPGYRFVPLFWMASSDHDFEEVRRAFSLDRQGAVSEIALPPEDAAEAGRVIAARNVGAQLESALAQLEAFLPGGEQREAVLAALTEDYSAGAAGPGGMLSGFARWMARLFAGTGLVLVDPQDPALMACARPLLRRELERCVGSEAALLARNAEIQAAGFPLQVEQLPGDTQLFLLDENGRRQKLSHAAGAEFVLRGTDTHFCLAELLALVDSAPERFVPGVMLRPLQQNQLIPAAAFVGGAAEIAYRAQTTAVFDFHAQDDGPSFPMAPALLRTTATLLPAKTVELLDELGWELPDRAALPQELAARAVSGERPEEVQAAVDAYLAALHSAEAKLKAEAIKLDPNLELTFETLRGNLIKHVETLSKKIDNVLKQRADARLKRVAQAAALAWPRAGASEGGAPKSGQQERMLGLHAFLPRYGFGLVQRLIDDLPAPSWEHQVVIL